VEKNQGFLPCFDVFNEYHKCVTREQYGDLNELEPKQQKYFKNFTDCLFKEIKSLESCRQYYDDIPRSLFRDPESKLKNQY
jgi:hypothetical protein